MHRSIRLAATRTAATRTAATRLAAARLAAAAILPAAAAAQDVGPDRAPDADPGTTIPRLAVVADSAQGYAVFLPPGHTVDRSWPAIVLLDPRGRALVPLEVFRAAAAEHGFVLLSSYNTSSDEATSAADTRTALEAILNDAVGPFAVDPGRVYLAGFSGTARQAYRMAVLNPDHVAGVAAFGAGIPPLAAVAMGYGDQLPQPGAYFGGAGVLDFNYQEVRDTEQRMAGGDGFAAFRYYPGPHGWPPAEVAAEAVEWFRLHGLRTGREPPDPDWAASRLRARLGEARRLEEAEHRYEAWRSYRRAADGFAGVADVTAARAAADRLAKHDDVLRTIRELDRWSDRELEGEHRLTRGLDLLDESRLPSADRLARAVGLDEILRAVESDDTLAAQAGERQRAMLLTLASFYRFRALLEAGRPRAAVRALELAERARPGWPPVCFRFRQVDEADRPADTPLAERCAER